MNTFEYSDKLMNLLCDDTEIASLLGFKPSNSLTDKDEISSNESTIAHRLRRQNVATEEFDSDTSLPFVAFYFADADKTRNDYMNKAILRIDIYAKGCDDVAPIRARVVELIHSTFDERVRAEGQRSSGITNVYKYRLEFTPLIFT